MDYKFVSMTSEHANAIVAQWKYDGEHSMYDYSNETRHVLDPEAWGVGLFAVLDGKGELIGELTVEFYDEKGFYTEYDKYADNGLINSHEMWIGFGLKPALVGKGIGAASVGACARYAVEHCDYRGDYIRLGVAAFNRRAVRAYERAGFQEYERTMGEIAGQEYEIIHMRMPAKME